MYFCEAMMKDSADSNFLAYRSSDFKIPKKISGYVIKRIVLAQHALYDYHIFQNVCNNYNADIPVLIGI